MVGAVASCNEAAAVTIILRFVFSLVGEDLELLVSGII